MFIILLPALLIVGCKKDNESDLEKLSIEVRASLEGEVIFYNNNSIYKTNPKSGGSGSLIAQNVGSQNVLKWSPEGLKVAYLKFEDSNWFLVIISREGVSEQEWILENPFDGFRGITWSTDGNTIACLSRNGTQIIYFEVASGKYTTTELINRPGYFYSSIAWWPKGNKIAIAEGFYIWLLTPYETNPTKDPVNLLASTIGSIESMDWNSDGSMLAYSGGTFYDPIYIVNSDGTGNHQIILKSSDPSKILTGIGPCWMSNNKQIIYTGVTGVDGSTLIPGLFVTDVDGSYKVDLNIAGMHPDCY
jgi:WD40 repeat protein